MTQTEPIGATPSAPAMPPVITPLAEDWPEPPYAPTEDDLPYDDGMPMETPRHLLQMNLLIETLTIYWADRDDTAVHGNMFVYFSPDQVLTHDYRGPDFFAAQGVARRERKSWLTWQEGKGPDVVIELLSETTAKKDKNEKKLVYQDRLRVPEYFWYDPFSGELAGHILRGSKYVPLAPDAQGRLVSEELNLLLARWEGVYFDVAATWLRWMTPAGELLPTKDEIASQEQHRAEAAEKHAEVAEQRAEAAEKHAEVAEQRAELAERRAKELEELLAQYRARFGEEPK
jgi:Uma2 family endonuclease